MTRLLCLLFGILCMVKCVPYEEKIITEVNLDIKDPVLQKILTFQDEHLADSIYPYFHHSDPAYRYVAATAFASIQDSTALDSLAYLLRDPIEKVRAAAAYSIGQTCSGKAALLLLQAFDQYDTLGRYKYANAAILEAIGKCSSIERLNQLANITTYSFQDTVLLLGQVRGIYRFALRDMISNDGTRRMIAIVINERYPDPVRLMAAHYLIRAKDIELETSSAELVRAFTKEDRPSIRMAIAIALGKTKSTVAREALTGLIGAEQDYRVKINMIRALSNFEYAAVKDAVLPAVHDKNNHIAHIAAEYFLNNGTADDARLYWQIARDTLYWLTQMKMYAAALKHLPLYYEDTKGQINFEIRKKFETTTNPFAKAAALMALSEFGWNFRYINEKASISDFPIVRSTGMRALAHICDMENFRQFFGLGTRQVKREIANYLMEGISNGDPGVIAEASILLRNPKMEFRLVLDSLTVLERVRSVLELPREIESYNELQHTISYLKNQAVPPPMKPEFNHPIDWSIFQNYTKNTRAIVKTAQGNITLKFYPVAAPGAVANFLKRSQEGFYNGKNFHRVVPNFVIQGGGPRGDGYGALDYSIRSELAPLYYDAEGKVGMASAGKDTEGTQFFITHSPAPHLDGRYTIFAEVAEGIDVVHKIQQGDIIQGVEFRY